MTESRKPSMRIFARHVVSFDRDERMSRNCSTKCQSCMMNAFMRMINHKCSTGKIINFHEFRQESFHVRSSLKFPTRFKSDRLKFFL